MRLMLILLSIAILAFQACADEFSVHSSEVDDRKAVIATVEPVHLLLARARIGGTIIRVKVKEGDRIAAGAEVATVVDEKLALQMQALDSRIRSQQAQRDQAKIDFDRVEELRRRGVSSQMQFDQARTTLDVADRTAAAMRSDREVIMQQAAEGAVLAPGAGRVLTVPVSEGRVVLPGETIATLAEDNYILRLALPERHARFMRAGDQVLIGARGDQTEAEGTMRRGKVRLVYPEIQGGRVIADVDVEELGNYFVGERTRVYVATGKRDTIVIPADYVYRRAGVNFVRLKDGTEVVVQPGEARPDGVEILSGLTDGDVVARP
ncbi:efflux RND transporter periplasmic adaptor subunit [Methylocapsa polymorpha]|uniref:Efflux RND transporter periplasmic adaptor subunit n=1 Tax=Methylocapsa polymorpha TaxID=3080828 RepID=A0ABZ0HST2_9HYPH|nr:efflux RND transporter periplasmic adaptor subunit [Methylocapsa sp. RX1]